MANWTGGKGKSPLYAFLNTDAVKNEVTRMGNREVQFLAQTWEGGIYVEMHADGHFAVYGTGPAPGYGRKARVGDLIVEGYVQAFQEEMGGLGRVPAKRAQRVGRKLKHIAETEIVGRPPRGAEKAVDAILSVLDGLEREWKGVTAYTTLYLGEEAMERCEYGPCDMLLVHEGVPPLSDAHDYGWKMQEQFSEKLRPYGRYAEWMTSWATVFPKI